MPTRFRVGQIVAVSRQSFRGKVIDDETWRIGIYVGRINGNYRVVLFPTWPDHGGGATVWTVCVPVQEIWPFLGNFDPSIV